MSVKNLRATTRDHIERMCPCDWAPDIESDLLAELAKAATLLESARCDLIDGSARRRWAQQRRAFLNNWGSE